jgi:hypothetical protein
MQLNGIEARLQQLVEQLPKGLAPKDGPETFQALIDGLRNEIQAAISEAAAKASPAVSAASTTPVTTMPSPSAPVSAASAPTFRTTSQLTPFQQSLLRQPGGQLFEQLSNDLTSASPLYNEREALLREGLDLETIERHLKARAAELDVEYDRSDLDGILRNSGYGAAHLGSTERYMAAVQKFIGEAENNYRQRSSNVPGSNA